MEPLSCPLCGEKQTHRIDPKHDFFHCGNCDLRFLSPERHLTPSEEKARYLTHNNDVEDPRYRKFVEPLFNEIVKRVPPGKAGLDFGAGPGPVLAVMLEEKNYQVALYDPFFHPHESLLLDSYDFIFASECAEHFYNPNYEFERIRRAISDGGLLGVMTHIFKPGTDITTWYYAKDPCHVVFYSEATMGWIKDNFSFRTLDIVGERIAILCT